MIVTPINLAADLRPTQNQMLKARSFSLTTLHNNAFFQKRERFCCIQGYVATKRKRRVQAMAIESSPINVVIFQNGFSRLWETECGKVREKEKSMIVTIKEEMTC